MLWTWWMVLKILFAKKCIQLCISVRLSAWSYPCTTELTKVEVANWSKVEGVFVEQFWQEWAVHVPNVLFFKKSNFCVQESRKKTWNMVWLWKWLLYFPAHKTHRDFFVRNFRKKNVECVLILVIFWNKIGLLHTKISNHNMIYSS
jgi:hypothetical protein